MGLHHHLLLLPLLLLLLLLNKREVTALDIDVAEPQLLVAEGGDVELACQVKQSLVKFSIECTLG